MRCRVVVERRHMQRVAEGALQRGNKTLVREHLLMAEVHRMVEVEWEARRPMVAIPAMAERPLTEAAVFGVVEVVAEA